MKSKPGFTLTGRSIFSGWKSIGIHDRVRIYYYYDEPICLATNLTNLDLAEAHLGEEVEFDTWFCLDDSPHLALVSENGQGLKWGESWMLAEILEAK